MSSFYKKNPEPQTQMREFNVGMPEETDVYPPVQHTVQMPTMTSRELSPAEREELHRLRQQQTQNKLGEHAKKRVEILTDIGRLTKDVKIYDITFSLRTLKNKENREATMSIFDCRNDVDASFELCRQTLARSIYQVDGQEIDLVLGGKDFDLKLAFIDEMEDVVINKLWEEFKQLRDEVRAKYGIETEQQAKEISEDIKK